MKRIIITLLIGVTLLFTGCGNSKELENKITELEKTIDEKYDIIENKNNEIDKLKNEIKDLSTKNTELQNKVDEAKPWFEMEEAERQAKEAELEAEKAKKAEEERIAKEKAEAEEKAKKEAEEQAKKEAEAHKYETGLTWEQIAREDRIGELGTFEGKVLQVMSAESEMQYRVAINGDYNQVMLVAIAKDGVHTTILEDDYIYFKGMSAGNMNYTTVMGAEKSIPAFVVVEYNF